MTASALRSTINEERFAVAGMAHEEVSELGEGFLVESFGVESNSDGFDGLEPGFVQGEDSAGQQLCPLFIVLDLSQDNKRFILFQQVPALKERLRERHHFQNSFFVFQGQKGHSIPSFGGQFLEDGDHST